MPDPDLRAAFDQWLENISEDAADSPLELAELAFKAGWEASDA